MSLTVVWCPGPATTATSRPITKTAWMSRWAWRWCPGPATTATSQQGTKLMPLKLRSGKILTITKKHKIYLFCDKFLGIIYLEKYIKTSMLFLMRIKHWIKFLIYSIFNFSVFSKKVQIFVTARFKENELYIKLKLFCIELNLKKVSICIRKIIELSKKVEKNSLIYIQVFSFLPGTKSSKVENAYRWSLQCRYKG